MNESLLLGEAMSDEGYDWEAAWEAATAPLLLWMPDWRAIGASSFGDVLTARLDAKTRSAPSGDGPATKESR